MPEALLRTGAVRTGRKAHFDKCSLEHFAMMITVCLMRSHSRNQSLLQVTYDEANQQWVLHIGEPNSVAVVRDRCPSSEYALMISDFGDFSSAVLELAFPCGEVIRQEFATRSSPNRHPPSQEMDDAVPIVIAD